MKPPEFPGVAAQTLRRWEREGRLIPGGRTPGGRRRYDLARLRPERFHASEAALRTVACARVSSPDQKDGLERQKQVPELYCARQGWTFGVIADPGSGLNTHKKGLKRLLDDVVEGRIGRLVVTHKDRLLRFGAEPVFAICETKGVEVVILNQGGDTTCEEDLAKDVLEIITVFGARLYGTVAQEPEAARRRKGRCGGVTMRIAHRIALKPDNVQATCFARAAGTARFACNWARAGWQRR